MKMEDMVVEWAIVAGQMAFMQGQEGEEGAVEGATGGGGRGDGWSLVEMDGHVGVWCALLEGLLGLQ